MCPDCQQLERRVAQLESYQPSGWGIVFRLLAVFILLPTFIGLTFWTIDQRAQVWAAHPEWTSAEVGREVRQRMWAGWEGFSIFTYRPFEDKTK